MGFDYVPGDMIAALTAEGMGEVDEVVLAYDVKGFGMTRGTQLSGLEMVAGGDVEWRKLKWMPADQSVGRGNFEFPDPIGRQRMVRYPAGEQITVPRHVATRKVRTMITASTLAPLGARPGASAGHPADRPRDAHPAAQASLGRLIDRLPEGPKLEDREAARFTIVCDVIRGGDAPPRRDPRLRRLRADRRRDRPRRASSPRGRDPPAAARSPPRRPSSPREFLAALDSLRRLLGGAGVERAASPTSAHGLSRVPPGARTHAEGAARRSASRTGRRPAAARCPACDAPLFVWVETKGFGPREDQVVDRCENCGLVVGARLRAATPRPPSSELLGRSATAGRSAPPNADSFQAWLDAENWAALRPGDAGLVPSAAVREAAALQGRA